MNVKQQDRSPDIRPAVAGSAGFLPAFEGMRGAAALGVMLTHVAFQTGEVTDTVLGRVWGRFDLSVALFFALSGYLLWRPHSRAARGFSDPPRIARYVRHRLVRIMPAYLVVVILVLLLLPEARASNAQVWLANLTLTQVYTPFTLVEGLTQMWSLSVEMAFYLALPLIAVLLARLRGRYAGWRIPVILLTAVASLAWKYVPIETAAGVHHDNWLPGYLSWFAAGMILAELAVAPAPAVVRIVRVRFVMPIAALTAFAVSVSPLAGPPGLVELHPREYAVKIFCGAVLGFALLAPIALAEPGHRHRILASPAGLMVGRWSYGIFLWHVAILMVAFPILGVPAFSGYMIPVLAVTVVLSLAVASVSYALVEEPSRRALRGWEARKKELGERPSVVHTVHVLPEPRLHGGKAAITTAVTAKKASS
ncbi:acyltransferase family protein [Hoyosella altamirensis]|uniref:Peptidoglycan/LPS O-acetylase OafA/YrhL n=1 Tax=Hoyosella altamirensis TaxID=616997 RepID=A0A839RRT5_9ACTN|nr:acyltransferase [Hoyosella altamirensis]MBB3039565.1 peptidoglycan/LPS O-acetylase OafA/YrhL [Hoyosella altamirensis]